MERSMASGRQVCMLPGAVAESSHLGYNHEVCAHTPTHTHERGWAGNGGEPFETSKPVPCVSSPPIRPNLLILPQNFHQVRIKCSNVKWYTGRSQSNHHRSWTHEECSQSMWGFIFCGRQHFLDTTSGRRRMFPLPLPLPSAE